MPQLVIRQRWKRYWAGQNFDRQQAIEPVAVLAPCCQHQQRVGDHGWNQPKMRAAHGDVAVQAQRVQVHINHAFGTGVSGRGGNVLAGKPTFAVPKFAYGRVVTRDKAHHLVVK